MGFKIGYITSKCVKCNTVFKITYELSYQRNYKKLPNLCKKCMKEYSKISKQNKYNSLDDNDKKDLKLKRTNHWNNSDYLEAASRRASNHWNSLSEIDKNKKIESFKRRWKIWYNSLSDIERDKFHQKKSEWWNNLSDEDKKIHIERLHTDFMNWWSNLTKDELGEYSDKQRSLWNNLSDEEKKIRIKKHIEWQSSLTDEEKESNKKKQIIGIKKFFDNLSEEEKLKRTEQCKLYWNSLTEEERIKDTERRKKWFSELSNEEFNEFMMNRLTGKSKLPKITKSELQFKEKLNLLKFTNQIQDYQFQYVNQHIHPEFEKLFPNNPVTGGRISPYHTWDFIITRNNGSKVLIDVDGGIHNIQQSVFIADEFDISAIIQFNDSKRPYQTDGIESYIILAYDDNVSDDTKVLSLQTNDIITVKDLLVLISCLYI